MDPVKTASSAKNGRHKQLTAKRCPLMTNANADANANANATPTLTPTAKSAFPHDHCNFALLHAHSTIVFWAERSR